MIPTLFRLLSIIFLISTNVFLVQVNSYGNSRPSILNVPMIRRQLHFCRQSFKSFVIKSRYNSKRRSYHVISLLERINDDGNNPLDKSSVPTTINHPSLLTGLFTRMDRTLSYKTEFSRNDSNTVSVDTNVTETLQDVVSNIRNNTNSISNLENLSIDKNTDFQEPINALLKNVQIRSMQVLESDIRNNTDEVTRTKSTSNTDTKNKNNQQQQQQQQHPDYSTNPTITTTALAHSLWSYVLRPGIDVAIDATAGNGYDSFAIAQMLFVQPQKSNHQNTTPQSSSEYDTTEDDAEHDTATTTTTTTQSMLYAIDIQLTACQNTTERLSSILPPHIMSNHVQIWHTSHETLSMVTNHYNNVALIVYNLGFLPGSHSKGNNKSITTKTMTTITSMGNAISLLRVGGMLSVTTYPRTNHQEDNAVQIFMETLALFSSQSQSWMEYLQDVPLHHHHQHHHNDDDDEDNMSTDGSNSDSTTEVREHLIQTLQQVHDDNPYQKWRVTQHKKLGRIDAPILFTAVRIQ